MGKAPRRPTNEAVVNTRLFITLKDGRLLDSSFSQEMIDAVQSAGKRVGLKFIILRLCLKVAIRMTLRISNAYVETVTLKKNLIDNHR